MWYVVVAVMGYLCCCSLVAMLWINRNLQKRFDSIVISRNRSAPSTGPLSGRIAAGKSNKKMKKSKARSRSKSSPQSAMRKKKKPHILSMDGDQDTDGENQTLQTHTLHPLPTHAMSTNGLTPLHHHLRHNRPRSSPAKYTTIHEQEPMQLMEDTDHDRSENDTERIHNGPITTTQRCRQNEQTPETPSALRDALVPRPTVTKIVVDKPRRGPIRSAPVVDCESPTPQIPTFRHPNHPLATVQSLAAASKVLIL